MAELDRPGEYGPQSRENLLDVVLEKIQKAGKSAIFSRVVYVARFSRREQNLDGLKEFHKRIIDKHDSGNEVSGMMLVYPACMVHMLEARTSTLMAILKDTVAAPQGDSKIAEARVVSSTEDISARCYTAWYCSFINTASAVDVMDPCDTTTIVKTASEVNAFLRKVGQSLTGQSEPEVRRRLTSLESYVDGTPAPEVLLSLTPAEDAPTMEEYLDIFNGPVNVDLDSESVWPMPTPLKF